MNSLLTVCPVCGDKLEVTRLHCRSCDSALEGHFDTGRLGRLSPEQTAFVETFLRCEGKLNRMERELGLSYPTLRSRLSEIIRQLGFPVGPEANGLSAEERQRLLDDLAGGRISTQDAMRLLEAE
jgi:hypothetical protein